MNHLQDGVIDEPSRYNWAYYPKAEDINLSHDQEGNCTRVVITNSMFDQGAVLQLLQVKKDTHNQNYSFSSIPRIKMPASLHTIAYITYCKNW